METGGELLVQITARHFCAGIVLHRSDGLWTVSEAAPIVRYMKGWSSAKVKGYVALKGWKAVKVNSPVT